MTRLRLYKDTKIKQDKNFMFDDIEDYLSNYEYKIFEVQYQKQEREIFLKLVLEQIYSNSLKENSYNYAVIDNEGEESSYYFISDITWTAYNTCKLHLTLDVLNTFKLGKHYELTDKTRVFREHKDRLKTVDRLYTTYIDWNKPYANYNYYKITASENAVSSVYCDNELILNHEGFIYDRVHFDYLQVVNNNGTYIFRLSEGNNVIFEGQECIIYASDLGVFDTPNATEFLNSLSAKNYRLVKALIRNIEKESEEFNATLYHNTEEDKIIEDSENNLKWSLLYINRDDISETNINNPVLCKLYPSKKIYINSDTFLLTQNNMPANKFMNISILENPNFKIEVNSNHPYKQTYSSERYKSVSLKFLEQNKVQVILFYNDASIPSSTYTFSDFEIICQNVRKIRISDNSLNQNTTLTDLEALPLDPRFVDGRVLVEDDNYINRLDSKIVKLITLPYCPIKIKQVTFNDAINVYQYDSDEVSYNSTDFSLQLVNLNIKFKNEIISNIDDPTKELIIKHDFTTLNEDLRNDNLESKIYHSDFYYKKFVYDSFSYIYQYELINFEKSINTYFEFDFIMSSSINSRFMFYFKNYHVDSYAVDDYNNYLIIARNNERTLYNSAYINYIKTGFNFDVKNKNTQNFMNWGSFALSLGATIATVASTIATSGATAPLLIGASVSTVGSFTNAINSTISSERNFEQKQEQLKAQSTNVINSDDFDLLNEYNKNSLLMMTYKVSERVRKLLLDLFYHYGYKCNEIKMPNLNTRKYFNFIQCEADIEEYQSILIKEEYYNMLVELYNKGVTLFHNYNGHYDIEQVKDNTERNLL